MAKAIKKNSRVKDGSIEIRGEYINSKTPILCHCNIHNTDWEPLPSSIYKNRGCLECGYEQNALARIMPYEEFIQRVAELGKGYTAIGEYHGVNKPMDFLCLKGHIWTAICSSVLGGRGCPYCAGKRVIVGETSLWDTRPDIAVLLMDPIDGYRYSAGSGQKTDFVCPDCASVHNKTICDVCTYGFSCPNCSDGISYPNKFARAMLKQLNVQNVEYEWNPDWLKPYLYDNYFEYNGQGYVLEMDGGLAHGKVKFNSKDRDTDGKQRDIYKDSLAVEHSIIIIRVDCDYPNRRRFEYIKNSILSSELANLFELSTIDWDLCDKQAQKKLVAQVAELYNDGLSMCEIQEIVGYTKQTIATWLKQADKLGLCNYDWKEIRSRGIDMGKILGVPVNKYSKNQEYIESYVSMAEAGRKTGISHSNISYACDNPNRSAGGFIWYKAFNPNQPDKTKIISSTIQN